MDLKHFISKEQLSVIREACKGEEGEYFRDMLKRLESTIEAMPKPYETEGQGDQAKAILHYFLGGSDWYITERDSSEEQEQAFGFACLNGDTWNAEMGYISIRELIELGVEFDLYYKPETIAEIKNRLGIER